MRRITMTATGTRQLGRVRRLRARGFVDLTVSSPACFASFTIWGVASRGCTDARCFARFSARTGVPHTGHLLDAIGPLSTPGGGYGAFATRSVRRGSRPWTYRDIHALSQSLKHDMRNRLPRGG